MNYTLQLSKQQMKGWKSWTKKYGFTNTFSVQETENGLELYPLLNDELDYNAVREEIIHSPILEKDKDGTLYYENEKGRGVHFPNGINPQIILDKLTAIENG